MSGSFVLAIRADSKMVLSKIFAILGLGILGFSGYADLIWDFSPLGWEQNGSQIRSLGLRSEAISSLPAAKKTIFTARLVPQVVHSSTAFDTMGIALGTDAGNFWSLQFIKRPQNLGGQHYFELGERLGGRWPAQSEDKIPGFRKNIHQWQTNECYFFRLELQSDIVRGEVKDRTGRVVFNGESHLKGRVAVRAGRPMLIQRGCFLATVDQMVVTSQDSLPTAPDPMFPKYESDDFIEGVVGQKTGFFHVEEIEGRWWVIDPCGRGTVIRGCDGISFQGPHCEALNCAPYGVHNRKAYPNKEAWNQETLTRLKSWGFNMLGNCEDRELRHRGLAHAISLRMGDRLCKNFDDDELWIGPDLHVPRTAFPNVFHPKFAEYCRYEARQMCTVNRNDPWLLGYFLDNELAWNGWYSSDYRGRASASTHVHSNRDPEGGMFDTCLAKAANHSARQALVAFMDARYGKGWERRPVPREAKLSFLEYVAETYFGTMAKAIREADPNHMILGARFDGLRIKGSKVLPCVWRAAGRHCDILTFNCYPWADLDRNYVRLQAGLQSDSVAEVFSYFHNISKKPLLITEWSFPALDSGLPCTGGAGQRVRTQTERVQASELFARTILALPFMLGYDYFKWVDQPELGVSKAFPEDSNYGLVDKEGKPYDQIVKMFTRVHKGVKAARGDSIPERREPPIDPLCTAEGVRKKLALRAVPDCTVTFTREGESYSVSNGAGMVWSGHLGEGSIFNRVVKDGKELGSFNGMVLSHGAAGRRIWTRTSRVESLTWCEEKRTLDVTARGKMGAMEFSMVYRFTFTAGQMPVVVELLQVKNEGSKALPLQAIYFRQHAPFELECADVARERYVPCWKSIPRAGWFARDGRWWGAATSAENIRTFSYTVNMQRKTVHPDAAFNVPDDLVLSPGSSYTPTNMFILVLGGTSGGASEQKRAIKEVFGF